MTCTHITLVVDRSGSMGAVRSDAEGAVNHFLHEQQKVDGEATLLLTEFDASYGGGLDDWYHTAFKGDLAEFPKYILNPRGGTALLDAIGMAIGQTNDWLLDQEDDDYKVIFVVQTDGQENSSREYKLDKVREMIKERTDEGWQFVFLGMGPDTFEQGHDLGFQNVTRSAQSGVAYGHTHSVMNAYVADYRVGNTDHLHAMSNIDVNAKGQVFDEEGNEIDPNTGKRLHTHKVVDNPQA